MTAAGWWKNETLDVYLDRWASERPTKLAIADATGRLTWQDLARAAERVAHGLAAAGIGAGDVVSSQLPDGDGWVGRSLATVRRGALTHSIPPTDPAYVHRLLLEALGF